MRLLLLCLFLVGSAKAQTYRVMRIDVGRITVSGQGGDTTFVVKRAKWVAELQIGEMITRRRDKLLTKNNIYIIK